MAKKKSPLVGIDWTDEDVGPFIKVVSGLYVPGKASPRNMKSLVDLLAAMTAKAMDAGASGDLGFAEPQWQSDMTAWNRRLAHYREVVDRLAVTAPNDVENAELWTEVVEPVVQGYFPGEESRKRPDAAVPLMLAHQARVADEAMQEAADLFWIDVAENAKGLVEGDGKKLGIIAIGVTVVVGFLALITGGRRGR